MTGETVAQVVTSDHPAYAAGDLVLAPAGWRTHALSDGTGLRNLDPAVAPVTTALGVLGMPGFTAYSIADGRIRYREDIVDGLEKAPEAFIGMLEGRNFGKLLVRVAGNADARTDHPTRHT